VARATLLPTILSPTPPLTLQPTVSAKAHILEQIRQAVVEYEQNVQAEKKTGAVEYSKDPQTGEDVFRFTGDSYATISDLHEKLWDTIHQLLVLYVQVYRDEARPTPFPTQASAAEYKAYYERLLTQGSNDCALAGQVTATSAATVSIYSPDDGKYVATVIDEIYARCEVEGQMIEEFRIAPILAKVNKDADVALIRQVTGKPALKLSFDSINSSPNAAGRSAAIYKDDAGTKYYVDVDTARLTQIEPGGLSHPNIPASQAKSTDELRGVARQFAQTNSPSLTKLQSVLSYQEGGKIDIYFFTWTYNRKDWSGTDWAMMPPFLQVGVLTNGQIYTYINTLDLYK
jgi:hypothetical protein